MNTNRKILIMGLPGAGKTTLAKELTKLLGAVHFNGDEIRAEINQGLDFSIEARIEQARMMGVLCDIVVRSGNYAVADFVCPTKATREAFGDAFVIWVNRKGNDKYQDTIDLFEKPRGADMIIEDDKSALYWAHKIKDYLIPTFNPKLATALFMGRWQLFTEAHKALVEEGLKRVGQVCIAIREQETSDKNPFSLNEVEQDIRTAMKEHEGKYTIVRLPNITNVFYGRDVGWSIEQIDLPDFINVSATKIREQIHG